VREVEREVGGAEKEMREGERDVREVERDVISYPPRTALVYGYTYYYFYTCVCVCMYEGSRERCERSGERWLYVST